MERHPETELVVFGVNTDSDAEVFRQHRERFGVTWPNIFQGDVVGPLTEVWGVDSFPAIYVLDREGVIRAKDVMGGELEAAVDALVAGEAPAQAEGR